MLHIIFIIFIAAYTPFINGHKVADELSSVGLKVLQHEIKVQYEPAIKAIQKVEQSIAIQKKAESQTYSVVQDQKINPIAQDDFRQALALQQSLDLRPRVYTESPIAKSTEYFIEQGIVQQSFELVSFTTNVMDKASSVQQNNEVPLDVFYKELPQARNHVQSNKIFLEDISSASHDECIGVKHVFDELHANVKANLIVVESAIQGRSPTGLSRDQLLELKAHFQKELKVYQEHAPKLQERIKDWQQKFYSQLMLKSGNEILEFEKHLALKLCQINQDKGKFGLKPFVMQSNALKEMVQYAQGVRYLKQNSISIFDDASKADRRTAVLQGNFPHAVSFNADAVGLLLNAGLYPISFKPIQASTRLQMQALNEVVDFVNAAAIEIGKLPASKQREVLIDSVLRLTQLSLKAAHRGDIAKAWNLIDLGNAIIAYTQAAFSGIRQGAFNTLQLIVHPFDSYVASMVSLIKIGEILDAFDFDSPYKTAFPTEIESTRFEKAAKEYAATVENAIKHMQSLTVPQAIELTTQFVTESLLTQGIFNSAEKLTKLGAIRIVAALDKAKPSPVVIGLKQRIVQVSDLFSITIDSKTAEIVQKNPTTIAPARQAKIAVIPKTIAQYRLELQNKIPLLERMFNGRVINIPGFKSITVHFDFKHLFDIQHEFTTKQGILVQWINGFHHDLNGWLGKNGVIKFLDIIPGSHGTFQAKVFMDGITFKNKSYFPLTWTRETVIGKICESMTNSIHKPFQQDNKNWVLRGITSEGIKIETILNESWQVITAYPMLKN